MSTRSYTVQIQDRPRPARPERETEPSQMDIAEHEGCLLRLDIEDIDEAIQILQAQRAAKQATLDTVDEIIHYRA